MPTHKPGVLCWVRSTTIPAHNGRVVKILARAPQYDGVMQGVVWVCAVENGRLAGYALTTTGYMEPRRLISDSKLAFNQRCLIPFADPDDPITDDTEQDLPLTTEDSI